MIPGSNLDDKSPMVEVMAWYHQTENYYLNCQPTLSKIYDLSMISHHWATMRYVIALNMCQAITPATALKCQLDLQEHTSVIYKTKQMFLTKHQQLCLSLPSCSARDGFQMIDQNNSWFIHLETQTFTFNHIITVTISGRMTAAYHIGAETK